MATYTLVVRVPDEMSQDALIEAVDGCGSLSDMRGAEVVFCGPGSLVQDVDPEEEDLDREAEGALEAAARRSRGPDPS